ncbi:hypothetical protein RvY_04175 [Ramazzottius varieornatus]|uniref:Uncharacterized protein n=1 Tax=Ramazzottius varieornatus TaxID=947166 RepID=A0A1D1UQN4_RAMVA|nr:hypothetical protein RvY_04175 [Ramazzottius varieornatus]
MTAGDHVINEAATGNSNEIPLLLDGQLLAKRFYNRTFKLRTGTYTFDQYGSLNAPDFVLEQFNETNRMALILSDEQSTFIEIQPINWIHGAAWPIADRPACGFDGLDPSCRTSTVSKRPKD